MGGKHFFYSSFRILSIIDQNRQVSIYSQYIFIMHESGELIMMVKILMCYPAVFVWVGHNALFGSCLGQS